MWHAADRAGGKGVRRQAGRKTATIKRNSAPLSCRAFRLAIELTRTPTVGRASRNHTPCPPEFAMFAFFICPNKKCATLCSHWRHTRATNVHAMPGMPWEEWRDWSCACPSCQRLPPAFLAASLAMFIQRRKRNEKVVPHAIAPGRPPCHLMPAFSLPFSAERRYVLQGRRPSRELAGKNWQRNTGLAACSEQSLTACLAFSGITE